MCDSLISYLQTNFPSEQNDAVEEATKDISLQLDGMKLFKREDNEFLNLGGGKKKNKKTKHNTKKDVIVHGVETIKTFALLQIRAPGSASDVSATVEELKAKKLYYQGLERGAVPSIASARKAERETGRNNSSNEKPEKPKKTGFSLENDFPGLDGTSPAPAAVEQSPPEATEAVNDA